MQLQLIYVGRGIKTKKWIKRVIGLFVIFSFVFNFTTISFAANTSTVEEDTNGYMSFDEYNMKYGNDSSANISEKNITDDDVLELQYTLSDWKIQTKNIVTKLSSLQIGQVTLKYKTYTSAGRPKFAYEQCYISTPPKYLGWSCTESTVDFSEDVIYVNYTYTNIINPDIIDYARVQFLPS